MPEAAMRLIVSGRVQGVGFRWYVADAARRLGLAGWVKNRSDGTVELCAAGSSESLSELEKVVRRGPSGSIVAGVNRADAAGERDLPKPFTIARD